MTVSEPLTTLPMQGSGKMRPSDELFALQERAAVVPVRTPAGDTAWLVTRHAEAKELLKDNRLGRSHADPANAPKFIDTPFMTGLIAETDTARGKALHHAMRAAMTPHFSARKIAKLQESVHELAESMIDEIMAKGAPADLHRDFSTPFAAKVLYDLMGVPEQFRAKVLELMAATSNLADPAAAQAASGELIGFMAHIVGIKENEPGDDVLTSLPKSGLTRERAIGLAMGLLFAGLDSVASHIDTGMMQLSSRPEEREAARAADPARLNRAVEEVLRIGRSGGLMLPHYATADIEIGGVTMLEGDLVLINLSLANFDPREYDHATEFDSSRAPNPHLTFSNGLYHCVGAPLARIELQAAFRTIFTRMPDVHFLISKDELSLVGHLSGGFARLPIAW